MTQRLATEYVKARLELTEDEMSRFVRFFGDPHIRMQVRVLDGGNQELVLEDDASKEEIRLTFERQEDLFVGELSCRLVYPKLTNAMRKAVSMFKGDAIVNRIYPTYTMVYYYVRGDVHKIIEFSKNKTHLVYESKNTMGQLEKQFNNLNIEQEIAFIQNAINKLLDLRNQAKRMEEITAIDELLREHARQLFMLEA
ncbi:non-ribosomal peptide synthetase module [Paenibacillus sp. GCM10012307]|uniref:Non-ribosomal peptide synthetase module n=1 Tax=Paenibacillus roseus TaxID=2798579 RepID=A0A934J9T5_9BACL|nr:non-ribosomal peptide synthetase module [Paenibacillus roseus]MBJ6362908.1 non-ribosomal peptide synthetase module [Paenibacillus roseus]